MSCIGLLVGGLLKNNIPSHVGFIPDGNRRWAGDHGMPKEDGYAYGINPGLLLFDLRKTIDGYFLDPVFFTKVE